MGALELVGPRFCCGLGVEKPCCGGGGGRRCGPGLEGALPRLWVSLACRCGEGEDGREYGHLARRAWRRCLYAACTALASVLTLAGQVGQVEGCSSLQLRQEGEHSYPCGRGLRVDIGAVCQTMAECALLSFGAVAITSVFRLEEEHRARHVGYFICDKGGFYRPIILAVIIVWPGSMRLSVRYLLEVFTGGP